MHKRRMALQVTSLLMTSAAAVMASARIVETFILDMCDVELVFVEFLRLSQRAIEGGYSQGGQRYPVVGKNAKQHLASRLR